MHDIAIEDHILLAFEAEFAGFLGARLAVVLHVVAGDKAALGVTDKIDTGGTCAGSNLVDDRTERLGRGGDGLRSQGGKLENRYVETGIAKPCADELVSEARGEGAGDDDDRILRNGRSSLQETCDARPSRPSRQQAPAR